MSAAEKQAAEALLQDKRTYKLGGIDYEIAPPTLAVIERVSSIISEMPSQELDESQVLSESLRIAKDVVKQEAMIVAVLIKGEKRPGFRGIKDRVELERLAEKIKHTVPPTEIQSAVINLLSQKEIGDFFSLTAFLLGIGQMKQKKAVMTAPGQQ